MTSIIKHIKILKFGIIFLSLMFFSCNDDNIISRIAVLEWQGDYSVDGCGFFFIINGERYKPENESEISDEFKVSDKIPVRIRFEFLNREVHYYCGLLPNSSSEEGIKIHSIEKL